MVNTVIWLTGPSQSGKTTLARALQQEIPCVVLDGDEMRDSISVNSDGTPPGFSRHDRRTHNLRVARLAKELSRQMTVVVAVIAPIASARREIDEICAPVWIRLKRTLPDREGHFYEEPKDYPTIDVDNMTVPEEVKVAREIAGFVPGPPASVFIGRYQPLHFGHVSLINKVLEEGGRVVVALRDTAYSDSDPYTIGERKVMLREAFNGDVEVVVVPDVKEICYGRKVGWGVREIRLDEETEEISATKIREAGESDRIKPFNSTVRNDG